MNIKIRHLKKSKPDNIIRLAKWLHLKIDGMSLRQIIKLINWRLGRARKRAAGMDWYSNCFI